jgi:hypothetical protein
VCFLATLPALAQQTGGLSGQVTTREGLPLADVRIQATSSVLPAARTTVSGVNGDYRLPYLPPGVYTLLFTHPGRATAKQVVEVLLEQGSTLKVALGAAPVAGALVVVEGKGAAVEATFGELRTALPAEVVSGLPLGRDYRSLLALIPSAPYSPNAVRGPSVGGSGQDNVHLFDGVNVNLPMYGTVSSEPSTHDLDQVAMAKGGAAAIGFNRSAGFTLSTLSKSGTDTFTGELSYQAMPSSLIARQKNLAAVRYDDSQTFTNGNVGGPILRDKLFFFFSYFRPTDTRDNSSNAYGQMPAFSSARNEYFGKLTYAPFADLLIHASHRDSTRTYHNQGVGGATYAPSTSDGGKVTMAITTVDAAWNVSPNSFLTFKFSTFANRNADRPDLLASAVPALDGSAALNLQDLTSQGQFAVPLPAAATVNGAGAYNAAIAPYVAKYGYPLNGNPAGGGFVGGYPLIDNHDFYRRNDQLAYDATVGGGRDP